MEKIIIKVPGTPVREVELPPGVHKVGRALYADLQIDHPSVSGAHCEISVNHGAIAVKDLGSTNGTFLDGQPVRECQAVPGQVLRFGEAEMLYAPALPAPRAARLAPPKPRRPARSFYQSIPGAFLYPFKRNGLILLGTGTVIFGIFEYLLSLRFRGFLLVSGPLGWLISAFITGYIFIFLQSIINSTAMGDDDMPPWPDYEGWWESAIQPYMQLVGFCIACSAPAVLCLWYGGEIGRVLFIPLMVLGCLYAPMALLAVAMDDSLLGLNPMLVVPSILRVPLEYLVTCLLLGLLLFVLHETTELIHYLQMLYINQQYGPGVPIGLRHPIGFRQEFIVGQIATVFFSLYFTVVAMRLLGLLYYTQKDRIGWRA